MRTRDVGVFGILAVFLVWLVGALVGLSFWGLIIYLIWHFAHKFW